MPKAILIKEKDGLRKRSITLLYLVKKEDISFRNI